MRRERSKKLYARAVELMPGGVNSPVRAFKSVGGEPIFIARGEGPYIYDVDGNRYIDYVGSWGPLILGHAAPEVIEAITQAAREGTSFGAPSPREVALAEAVIKAVPSVHKVRFVSSGTEATMSALRLARGFTGRDRVIKFAGCYHGHADAFLADAGSGVATLGIPGSAGVPRGAAADTLTVPFNDLEAVRATMAQCGHEVAAIIVEPIACNIGMILPQDDFLPGLRQICDEHGALLIFDEVITGFRVGLGGAQARFGVQPDLTTFGKIIGGGLPVGAYGGRVDVMDKVAPLGPVYQAGTLSGNPLAMAAGLATLEAAMAPGFYERLEALGAAFERGVSEVLAQHGHPAKMFRVGSVFFLWFLPGAEAPPRHADDIKKASSAAYARMFRSMLGAGVALAPSAFEVGFLGAAHGQNHIDATVSLLDRALGQSAES